MSPDSHLTSIQPVVPTTPEGFAAGLVPVRHVVAYPDGRLREYALQGGPMIGGAV